jgi:hypothetical protein
MFSGQVAARDQALAAVVSKSAQEAALVPVPVAVVSNFDQAKAITQALAASNFDPVVVIGRPDLGRAAVDSSFDPVTAIAPRGPGKEAADSN